jgi:DNA anti-recombination protein RmuC
MNILSKSDDSEKFEEQLKILATNIEVLNQRLIANPETLISPAETQAKERMDKITQMVQELNDFLKNSDSKVERTLTVQNTNVVELLAIMKRKGDTFSELVKEVQAKLEENTKNFSQISKEVQILPEYKKKLDEQLTQFDQRLQSLNSINKEWLHDILMRIDAFHDAIVKMNKNLITFNDNIDIATKQIDTIVQNRIGQISEQVISRISKYLIWFVVGIAGMSFIFASVMFLLIFKVFS